ncbi:MAG: hypothetical protein R3256_01445 [Thalassovita sp.]|nr:hypothetical protein [Thalassovita sp.]
MVESRLSELTWEVRRFLEPRWAAWHRREGSPVLATPSQGTCGRSSLFLCRVLLLNGYSAEFAAGDPTEGRKGFRTSSGWKGHAWVQNRRLILDVTADQFGQPPVVITQADDPRYGRGTDTAEPQFISRRQRAVERLMADWAAERRGRAEHET